MNYVYQARRILKKLRTENNLSQEKLGEKLGISRQSISKWEQGNAVPNIENIMKLAKLYNVSVDSILNGEEDKKEETAKQENAPEKSIEPPAYIPEKKFLKIKSRRFITHGFSIPILF